ncbi:ras guanine nucleotide exchange factor R-like [Drosophila nasuta]|uniref:ras guanine nucleotide exchange factor R-like n=1 Tax=Drosophila nasuta TaxID=42062 RepID=UPI00295EBFCC|nr:ras guanine nucleotide exchange factor R-like [Drosophila nasuta]
MDAISLINNLKQRPALWDASHPGHGKREEIRNQWLGVAEAMEANVELCRRKWQNLRSSYRRWQSRANSSSRTQWQYAEAMSFLGGHRADEVPDFEENLEPEQEQQEQQQQQEQAQAQEHERDADADFMMSFVPKMKKLGSVKNANFRVMVSEAWLRNLQQPPMPQSQQAKTEQETNAVSSSNM